MNRGARRQAIFLDDDDRNSFVGLLGGLQSRFDTRVVSYCLMGNHFHLALRCPEPALSRSMQWLASRHTRRFNARHGFDGPLCKSRFTSVEITDDAQLVAVVRYIHRNPLALSARLDLAAYEWSSHGAYVGARQRPSWLETSLPLSFFDGDVARFHETVEKALPFDAVANRPPLEPVSTIGRSKVRKPPTLLEAERAVATAAAASVEQVRQRRRGLANDLNDCLLILWADSAGVEADQAEALGFASTASANRAVVRARTRAATDRQFGALVDRAHSVLFGPGETGLGPNPLRPSA